MPKKYPQAIGKWGETVAARYLEQHGYRVIAHNARTPYGEIDLVMQTASGAWVFVEVKTRTSGRFGNPEEAVDRRKLEHMTASAQAYLLENSVGVETWRIDVLAIQGRPGDKVEDLVVEHFEDIAN